MLVATAGVAQFDGQYVIGSEYAAWLCGRLDLAPTPRLRQIALPTIEARLLHQIETGVAALEQASGLLCVASAQELRLAAPKANETLNAISPSS